MRAFVSIACARGTDAIMFEKSKSAPHTCADGHCDRSPVKMQLYLRSVSAQYLCVCVWKTWSAIHAHMHTLATDPRTVADKYGTTIYLCVHSILSVYAQITCARIARPTVSLSFASGPLEWRTHKDTHTHTDTHKYTRIRDSCTWALFHRYHCFIVCHERNK